MSKTKKKQMTHSIHDGITKCHDIIESKIHLAKSLCKVDFPSRKGTDIKKSITKVIEANKHFMKILSTYDVKEKDNE